MPFRFADAILELPDDLVAGDVIVPGHSDTLSFEYEPELLPENRTVTEATI